MFRLTDSVTVLSGVGPSRAKQLEALNIRTLGDLICHFPRGYEDRTKTVTISQLEAEGAPACFRAMVLSTPRTFKIRKGLEVIKTTVGDHTGKLNLTFFNQKFTAGKLEYGKEYMFYGALEGDWRGYGMTSPVVESLEEPPTNTRCIVPRYPLTAGLSNAMLMRLIAAALAVCPTPEEVLPAYVRQRFGIVGAAEAYGMIHRPKSMAEAEQARKRMIFEEFFVFSAGLHLLRAHRAGKTGHRFTDTDLEPFYHLLPFSLTGAQRRAIEEIRRDMSSGKIMNRLVQGDVGSGKTMVAAAAACLCVQNNCQVALMAPTEILAEQHYKGLCKLLAPLGIRVGLLRGSMTPKEKAAVRDALLQGEIDFIIGTHALVSKSTEFANLGLVITDEQHRFGVAQRGALSEKGTDPHLLVMSATPIPRTLALLMYGDLEVSVLDELPPGRQKIDTFLVNESYRARINAFIRKQVQEGHQCYVVCPAVEENEELGLKAAETWAETLQNTVFPDMRIAMLHGKLKGEEKEAVMASFARQEADILVATTVIEVGVDVPNATLMVIEDADRFGLSQLHQLRGRVGRGEAKSYCVMFSQNKNPETKKRLEALCKTNDGFRIAQEDLQMRGPGDFFGARQSGLPIFRVADLSCDLETLSAAQQASKEWIEAQGTTDTPEAAALRRRIGDLFKTVTN